MPCPLNSFLDIHPFVGRGIVHDNDAMGWHNSNKSCSCPGNKYIGINGAGEQTGRQKARSGQRPNNIGSAFGMPTAFAGTTPNQPAHTLWCAACRAQSHFRQYGQWGGFPLRNHPFSPGKPGVFQGLPLDVQVFFLWLILNRFKAPPIPRWLTLERRARSF
jgi:hypothetical protein